MEDRIAELHEVPAPEPPPPADVPEPVPVPRQRWTLPGWVWAVMGAVAAWAVLHVV